MATLAILDVGHGNASVVREGNVVLLIDAGRGSHVLEYLFENNITTIDLAIVSHSDADHIGGLIGLLTNGIKVNKIILNSDSLKDSEGWRDLIFTFEDARRGGELDFKVGLSTGDAELTVNGFVRCRAEIVAPTPENAALGAGAKDRLGNRITSNSISACIRIHFDGKPVALLAGDMDDVSLNDCIRAHVDLQAPILVFPHHGGLPGNSSASVFTAELMRQTQAKRVYFSIGRHKHENPRPEIIDVIKASGAHIACTQLSMHCSKDLQHPPSQVSSVYSAGKRSGTCCSGTIEIDLAHGAPSDVFFQSHVAFVKLLNTPLCRVNSS